MNYILYNPISGHGNCKEVAEKLSERIQDSSLVDMTAVDSLAAFVSGLGENDVITVCGGDGTLNRFVNAVCEADYANKIFYYPCGTGNDFFADISSEKPEEPVEITKYLKDLPTVTVNGKSYKFINGVGYGIDGYCCEMGDKGRAKGKKVNYTAIAIKGMLFSYKARCATVTVDGETHEFKKAWLAPSMFGRHYGGGMIPTPDQSRDAEPKKLSVMLFHGSGRLKTLMIFPKIFEGKHVESKKYVTVLEGKTITVKFDKPTALQIDGETIVGVTEYTATV